MKTEHIVLKAMKERRLLTIREIRPPAGSDPAALDDLLPAADEVPAVADNPDAAPVMAALAAAAHIGGKGRDVILEINCRDRNRIDIQSLVLGAVSLGIGAFLIRPGVHQTKGAMPDARNVFDLDPVQVVHVLSGMRRDGRLSNGADVTLHTSFALGIQINPNTGDMDLKPLILKKKITAGADFFVTHPITDLDRLKSWRERVADIDGLSDRPVYVGIPKDADPPPSDFLESNGFAGVYRYAG